MRRLSGSLLLLLSALPALGAESEHAGGEHLFLGQSYELWQLINLALFLGLLVYFLRKPVAEFFRTRTQEVQDRIKKSEEDARRASELLSKLQGRLAEVEAELVAMKAAAEKHAEAEEVEILKAAEDEARRIADRAVLDIESRIRTARKELTVFATGLALDLARETVRRGLTADDQKRLLEEGFAALEASASAKSGRPN